MYALYHGHFPTTITTLTLEHTELTYLKIHFYGVKKTLATATQANSLHTQTNSDPEFRFGSTGLGSTGLWTESWFRAEGRALLYWVTIFAQISFLVYYVRSTKW